MFFRARGCEKCANTGFTLLIDDVVGPLVLKSADAQSIKRAAAEQGMDTLRDDGARKVLAGLTTVEEVLAAKGEDVDPVPQSASGAPTSIRTPVATPGE
jgi:general secretion pathway protein E